MLAKQYSTEHDFMGELQSLSVANSARHVVKQCEPWLTHVPYPSSDKAPILKGVDLVFFVSLDKRPWLCSHHALRTGANSATGCR